MGIWIHNHNFYSMKKFHEKLEEGINMNLKQYIEVAEILNSYRFRISQAQIAEHLKQNKEKIRSKIKELIGDHDGKDMDFVERGLKKMEKGDFSL